MQRISLGKPYEAYIDKMINAGYYASATEVIRDALRLKMKEEAEARTGLQQLVDVGLADIAAGRVVKHHDGLLDEIYEKAKIDAKNNKSIPNYITP
jgi:putative addiction module CopG family antidote